MVKNYAMEHEKVFRNDFITLQISPENIEIEYEAGFP